ncbi:hypothetical protein A9Q83_01355 [Alphaproteobacteria bacterium 46_93_T64]|mgnify:CR=1 FL=1|nr:hypothetical protein A9Q83_01355 [Alphaproteobacteria bacterium 46_93_T64]
MKQKRNSLTEYEVSIIKNLLERPEKYQNQEISGMINRYRGDASKDINAGRISNIKNGQIKKYLGIGSADNAATDAFLSTYNSHKIIITDDAAHISETTLAKLLPLAKDSTTHLDIIETDQIECKKGFSLPIKTIAAFANNKGGYLVLGVVDKTWEIVGIKEAKIKSFDFNQLNQTIRSNLGIEIEVKRKVLDFVGKKVAVFHVAPAHTKPVIFAKDGDDTAEGKIYYRYIGEDRLITASDLSKIIEDRVRNLSETVLNKHLSRILQIGIENAAIMDISTGEVEGKAGSFYVDEKLLPDLKFIKEGEFVEKAGKPALRLVGEVQSNTAPLQFIKEEVFKIYPYSYKELETEVKKNKPLIKQYEFNRIIKEEAVKLNKEYSDFLFTNKLHAENYANSGKLPSSAISRYNEKALKFILSKL